jgi:hypothetical protein
METTIIFNENVKRIPRKANLSFSPKTRLQPLILKKVLILIRRGLVKLDKKYLLTNDNRFIRRNKNHFSRINPSK